MIQFENPLGTVDIDAKYFSELLGSIVPTCFGVTGMSDLNVFQSVRSFLDRKHQFPDQGVSVRNEPGGLVIELHIVVTYGLNIETVVRNIVEKVRYTVEDLTGLTVKNVQVFVDEMKS